VSWITGKFTGGDFSGIPPSNRADTRTHGKFGVAEPVTDWTMYRDRTIAALDFLPTGI
jgi:hypothetical protein